VPTTTCARSLLKFAPKFPTTAHREDEAGHRQRSCRGAQIMKFKAFFTDDGIALLDKSKLPRHHSTASHVLSLSSAIRRAP
jgi:hypothetical protein